MSTLKKTLTVLATLVLGTLTATTALATTSHHPADHSPSSSKELNGTWLTSIQLTDAPPGAPSSFNALDTFLPGGGLVVSSSAAGPTLRSLAQGSWTHLGHRNFTSTFVWFRFDPTGQPLGTQRVRRTMRVSESGTTFSGTDIVEIVAPTGAVLATIHGTESGTLIPS
jgi:hypothetical protein